MVSQPSADGEGFLHQLQQQIEGLVWISETDAPFAMIHWPPQPADDLTIAMLSEQANLSPETPIQVLDLADFLAPATRSQPWHSDEEAKMVVAFQSLETLLRDNLQKIRVYCCGTIEQTIYILGRWLDGSWVGLMTQAVET